MWVKIAIERLQMPILGDEQLRLIVVFFMQHQSIIFIVLSQRCHINTWMYSKLGHTITPTS